MYDVITIGTATLDVILPCPELKKENDQNNKPHLILPHGTKIEIENVQFETGGGATNAATTFARQGLKPAVIAKIGKDISGDRVISRLKEEHIDTSFLVVDQNDTTDFTTIIYSPQQGSVLLISRGKGRLEADNIPWDSLQANWFYVTSVEGNLNILEKLENTFISGTQKSEIAWNKYKRIEFFRVFNKSRIIRFRRKSDS